MKNLIYFFASILLFTSCEEILDLDLNSMNPKIVIEADLNDLSNKQSIHISRTVDFDELSSNEPINKASVKVVDRTAGGYYDFIAVGSEGEYICSNFKPKAGNSYMLYVQIEEDVYTSECVMPAYIPVDSLGISEDEIFGEKKYSVTLKFNDPANVENFYKYKISVNQNPKFEFAAAFNDKFNDGKFVTHQLSDQKNSIELNDTVTVIRSIIDKSVYKFWNDVQSINPGSAAPANPTSNITNGALGYFSVSSSKVFGYRINIKKD